MRCRGDEGRLSGAFDRFLSDLVDVELPNGSRPAFVLATEEKGDGFARAGIVKDAGDDPDVTHGALIESTVRRTAKGAASVSRLAREWVSSPGPVCRFRSESPRSILFQGR